MGHLAAASLIVAAWSLGHFVDLKEAGYNNDARLRKVARALASISGIAPVQYTVRDYIEAFRVNAVDHEPWIETFLTPAERIVALYLADTLSDWGGSPRVLAAALIDLIARQMSKPLMVKDIAEAMGCSVQALLRVERSVETLFETVEGEKVTA